MPRVKVALTRSTLLETQRTLALAREGHDLLDRKREILLAELTAATPEAERARDELMRGLSAAYEELARARMALGADPIRRAALASPHRLEAKITERSVVGAVLPAVSCPAPDLRPRYSLADTSAELDRAAGAFARLVEAVCAAAQTEAAVMRLAREIRKTQRRVNALRNVVIPTQEEIIKVVREALEDVEREDFFRTKRLRARREARGRRDERGL